MFWVIILLTIQTIQNEYSCLPYQKGTIDYHTKRELSLAIPKGKYHCLTNWILTLSIQKGMVTCHTKKVLLLVIQKGYDHLLYQKGYYHLPYQKGTIICHTKRVLSFAIPKGYYHLPYKQGSLTCHAKWGYIAYHIERVPLTIIQTLFNRFSSENASNILIFLTMSVHVRGNKKPD